MEGNRQNATGQDRVQKVDTSSQSTKNKNWTSRRGTQCLVMDSRRRLAHLQELLRSASRAALRVSRCADELVGTATLAGAGGGGDVVKFDAGESVLNFVNNNVTVSTILFALSSSFFSFFCCFFSCLASDWTS